MTTVHVDIRRPQAGTTDRLPAAGSLDVSLYRRQVEGAHVLLVTRFAQVLVDGQATLQLTPTDGTNAWVVNERVKDGRTRVVAVPAVVGTVEYAALPDLDLATLTTSVAAEAAWAAIAADVAAIKANGTGTASGAAGGFLSGSYPNPGVNTTALDQAVAARIGAPTSQTATALAATYATKADAPAGSGATANADGSLVFPDSGWGISTDGAPTFYGRGSVPAGRGATAPIFAADGTAVLIPTGV